MNNIVIYRSLVCKRNYWFFLRSLFYIPAVCPSVQLLHGDFNVCDNALSYHDNKVTAYFMRRFSSSIFCCVVWLQFYNFCLLCNLDLVLGSHILKYLYFCLSCSFSWHCCCTICFQMHKQLGVHVPIYSCRLLFYFYDCD